MKRSELKQDDIVNAAIRVFSDSGYQQASMEQIAKSAEVSKRTLYKYYPSKDVLFTVIVDKLLCRFDEADQSYVNTSTSLEQQLKAITQQQLCYLNNQDFHALARMVISESVRCPNTAQIFMTKLAQIDDNCSIRSWVEKQNSKGNLNIDNVPMAVEQYIGSIKACVFWPQMLAHHPIASADVVDQTLSLAVSTFLARFKSD